MTDLPTLLESTSITIPLDVMLELIRAARGDSSEALREEVDNLLKLEVIGTLEGLSGVTEEQVAELVAQTFGDTTSQA
ncbi:hypothetical protein [Sphingomonas sp. BK235]|uniref:hypothetical protein n=1 Tax=Sphingomonas sp. BK235 TaxID=2512131 RepID=UPI00104F927F|nr:hypothetical protein [Sphingomonas sp. BK235]TCP32465.1 hypothetical protein EV292_10897 [Sphingomonas sp. BK235]